MPKNWPKLDTDIVRVTGTGCIQITETLKPQELELIRQFPEVHSIEGDGGFINLITPIAQPKKWWRRQQNPYGFANAVAARISDAILGPRIEHWVNKKLEELSGD